MQKGSLKFTCIDLTLSQEHSQGLYANRKLTESWWVSIRDNIERRSSTFSCKKIQKQNWLGLVSKLMLALESQFIPEVLGGVPVLGSIPNC